LSALREGRGDRQAGLEDQLRTLKLTIQYDGTDFVGWQRQAEGVSIQGLIEDALAPFEGAPVTLHGAGRTDAGVHALAQVASVSITSSHDVQAFHRGLNAVLPLWVRIVEVVEAAPDFHARFNAIGKAYEYRIVNAPFVSPFIQRYAWHVPIPLNVEAMRLASEPLLGEQDFAAFQGTGAMVSSTRRTVESLTWDAGGSFDRPLVMRIEGDGFLRHMVRNIVGTLVEVGTGRWPGTRIPEILASRDRRQAGPAAPASGLFLVAVKY
jgi:tRNA pseudouridine38-40 synthase